MENSRRACMCDRVSELETTVPSTLLHPCSIFQGCHALLHFTEKGRKHRRSRSVPEVTQLCRWCWPGAGAADTGSSGSALPQPAGVRTGNRLATRPSPWLSVKLIKWTWPGPVAFPPHLTPALLGARPEDRLLLLAATCKILSVIGED